MSTEDILKSKTDIHAVVMRLLANREHSRMELQRKLEQRGFAAEQIIAVLDQFAANNLQSDSRYTENYIAARQQRGYGPVRIQVELREHGVADTVISEFLDFTAAEWLDLGSQARQKKFGAPLPVDYPAKVRQMRFLEYRGFTHPQLRRILESADDIA